MPLPPITGQEALSPIESTPVTAAGDRPDLGTDPRTDVALLKVEGKNLPTVKLGDSEKLKVGAGGNGSWGVCPGCGFQVGIQPISLPYPRKFSKNRRTARRLQLLPQPGNQA